LLGVLPLVVVWIGAKAWSTRKLASRPTRGCERLIGFGPLARRKYATLRPGAEAEDMCID
jgi:hypothetical protein